MKNGLFKKWLTAALCVLALGSTAALAEPDTFGLGTGRNGPLTVSAPGTPINIYAQVKATLSPGTRTITVGSTPGFALGDLIMVLQSTGIETVPASGDASEVSLNGSQVGRWEFARLESVSGTTLTLTAPLVYGYAVNVTQVIRVREYTDVTIDGSGSIIAQPWDPLTATGGVVAFLSQGAVTNNGVITATGSGFRGGTFVNDISGKLGCTGLDEPGASGALKGEGIANTRYGTGNTGRGNVANAGGGGVCLKSGGGGGGNGGAGGLGGASSVTDSGGVSRPVGGMGGARLAFSYDVFHRLTFGGGGGAGHGTLNTPSTGGAGGGIVFIRARELTGAAGVISAAGDSGTLSNSDASSGGGGGGSIYLRLAETISCAEINVSGGTGGSTNASRVGPGGGGGGGRLLLQAKGTSCIDEESYSGSNPGTQRATSVPAAFGAQTGGAGVFHQLPGGFTVPTAEVTSPTGLINLRRPEIKGTTEPTSPPTDPKTRVIIYIDGVEVGSVEAAASGAFVFPMPTDIIDGEHTVQAVAEHYGVRGPLSAPKTFIVDATAPEARIVSGPPSLGNSTSATFDLDVRVPDTGVVYECRLLPETTFTPCTDPANFTVPADGTYRLAVRARDAAGNVGPETAPYTWTVDTKAPEADILSGPPALGNSRNVTFDLDMKPSEPGATYQCRLLPTETDFTACTDPANRTVPDDGSYTLEVRVRDALGNVSAPDSWSFTVDATPPVATIESRPPALTNSKNATFDLGLEKADTGVVYECKLSPATTFSTCTDPANFTDLSEGEHTLAVRARDSAGNVGPETGYTWTVDTTAPVAEIVSRPPSVSNSRNATFDLNVEAADTGVVYECRLSPATTFSTCTDPANFTVPADGSYTLVVRARDAAGNVGPETDYSWTVDTRAPDTRIVSGPPSVSNSRNAAFDLDVVEPEAGVTYACRLLPTDATFTPCTDPANLTVPADGMYTLEVSARDVAGNEDASPATYTWVVDTMAPAVPVVVSPAPNSTVDTLTPVIRGTAEPHSTVTVIIDGTVVGTVRTDESGNWRYTPTTPLTTGEHRVQVRATDEAGNTGATSPEPTPFTIVQDTSAPETNITSGPLGSTPERTATFELGSNEPGVTYECSLDGAAYTPCTSPVTFTGLADGEHTLLVRARDAAGNVDATPATWSWTVAATGPGGDIAFLGDGVGCSATGGDASLLLMGLGTFLTLSRRRRRS